MNLCMSYAYLTNLIYMNKVKSYGAWLQLKIVNLAIQNAQNNPQMPIIDYVSATHYMTRMALIIRADRMPPRPLQPGDIILKPNIKENQCDGQKSL